MAHFLSITQLAEEAAAQGLSDVVIFLEQAAQYAALAIVEQRGDVKITQPASNEVGFGGLCVGFGAINEGDKCPEDFREYDSGSDWASE